MFKSLIWNNQISRKKYGIHLTTIRNRSSSFHDSLNSFRHGFQFKSKWSQHPQVTVNRSSFHFKTIFFIKVVPTWSKIVSSIPVLFNYFQTDLFDPKIGPWKVLPLQNTMDLRVMVKKVVHYNLHDSRIRTSQPNAVKCIIWALLLQICCKINAINTLKGCSLMFLFNLAVNKLMIDKTQNSFSLNAEHSDFVKYSWNRLN